MGSLWAHNYGRYMVYSVNTYYKRQESISVQRAFGGGGVHALLQAPNGSIEISSNKLLENSLY